MRQCLTSDQGGYYTTTRSIGDGNPVDQFGTKGDFITSPEISQVFGELVGIWFVSEWLAQTQGRGSMGGRGKARLMELGPGRGTLMDDILRTIRNFEHMTKSLEAVYLVEASEALRHKQHKLLCGEEAEIEKTSEGWKSISKKYFDAPVFWVEDVALLPKSETEGGSMPLLIAHEFFDALPIHAFESVAAAPESEKKPQAELLDKAGRPMVQPSSASKVSQWREYLVAPSKKRSTINTPTGPIQAQQRDLQDFQLTLANASTPSSLVLPETSPRYKALKSRPGSSIEISPESNRCISEFAKRIGNNSSATRPTGTPETQALNTMSGDSSRTQLRQNASPAGAALIIDYGPSYTIPINSLRGIRAHKRVSPFTSPGEVDISADVDFTALAEAALTASEGVEVYGPVEQGAWLHQLGGTTRVEQLVNKAGSEERKKDMLTGWKRLVEGSGLGGMGEVYKVMAIVPESGGKRRPVGFGGEVPV